MAEEVRELLVKVSATTELLRSNLIAAEREIAKFQTTTDVVTQRVERNFKQVGASSGQLKSGMQQLSYQLNDVATMFSLGAKPQQIFASQMGQVIQSVQLMTGGTSKLATFLGGPWGLAIGSAAVALTPFIAKLFETSDAADTATNALEALAKKRADAISQQFQLNNAEKGLNTLLERRSALEADIAKRGVRNSAGQLQFVYKQQQDLAAVNAQIAAARADIDRERVVRTMGEAAARIPTSGYATPRVTSARSTSGTGSGGRAARSGGRANTADNDPITPEIRFRAEMAKITNQIGQDLAKVRDKEYEDQIELINRKADYEFEARQAVLDRLRQAEANQINFLANMFEDAFRGGTNAIWSNFKNIGLAVISQVMAQFAISRSKGEGFNLGNAFSIGLQKVLGFADGGRPPVGRISMVGERGPELFVPDVAGTIIPNHALGGGGVSLTINAPGATAETVAMIRRELANAAPALVAAASGNTVRALNRKSL